VWSCGFSPEQFFHFGQLAFEAANQSKPELSRETLVFRLLPGSMLARIRRSMNSWSNLGF
jgi:hypothetical protein